MLFDGMGANSELAANLLGRFKIENPPETLSLTATECLIP
jgi:hypothetical protein